MLARLVTNDQSGAVSHSVVSLQPQGEVRASMEAAGTPVQDLGIRRKRDALRGLFRLVRIIRTTRPAVVHSWLYHADLLAILALALSGRRSATRLIWGIRCSDMDMRRYARTTRWIRAGLSRLSSRTDLVLCNSDAGRTAHERLGYRPPRWHVLPNGLDLEHYRPQYDARAEVRRELGLADDDFVIGMCARVDPMKDHRTFVEAACRFAEIEPNARFVLIGPGTDKRGTELDRVISSSGVAWRFVRLGRRRNVARIHATLDVAALTSAFGEGFPNVLAEAMACGVPCVATDVGDSSSIIGDTGLIVPPRDAKALAAAWGVLRNEAEIERAGRSMAARRRAEDRYAIENIVSDYAVLYRDLIESGFAPGSGQAAI